MQLLNALSIYRLEMDGRRIHFNESLILQPFWLANYIYHFVTLIWNSVNVLRLLYFFFSFVVNVSRRVTNFNRFYGNEEKVQMKKIGIELNFMISAINSLDMTTSGLFWQVVRVYPSERYQTPSFSPNASVLLVLYMTQTSWVWLKPCLYL